jgi:hypothetical protein
VAEPSLRRRSGAGDTRSPSPSRRRRLTDDAAVNATLATTGARCRTTNAIDFIDARSPDAVRLSARGTAAA